MERAAASTSSTEAAPQPQRLLAGWVAGAHGLRGRLRVRCAGGVEPFDVEHVFVGASEALARRHAVVEVGPGRSGEVRLALADVADREAAEALRGAGVWIEPGQLGELPEGEFWGFQLIGCEVEVGSGRRIGTVREIVGVGAQDLLRVIAPDGREHLIPAVRQWWLEVDLERRRIVMELPAGLLDPA
jgi:16S rRNA processing protein RimM